MKKINEVKIIGLLSDAATLMTWGGVLLAGYNHQDSKLVSLALTFAILGLMLDKMVRVYVNKVSNLLNNAESRERSYLNIIRSQVVKSKIISADLMDTSKSASNEAEIEFKKVNGFNRPAFAICMSTYNEVTDK